MEDEVYDDVNDNYQYLPTSPLARPDFPLDLAITDFSNPLVRHQYGAFVFFRYLSERLARPVDRPPDLGARRREPDRPGRLSPSRRSTTRSRSVAGIGFAAAFSAFAAVNAFPASFYEEGAAYPTPPIARPGHPDGGTAEVVGPGRRSTTSRARTTCCDRERASGRTPGFA